jgi:hypothetical protein
MTSAARTLDDRNRRPGDGVVLFAAELLVPALPGLELPGLELRNQPPAAKAPGDLLTLGLLMTTLRPALLDGHLPIPAPLCPAALALALLSPDLLGETLLGDEELTAGRKLSVRVQRKVRGQGVAAPF